jgi:hypothetical protein
MSLPVGVFKMYSSATEVEKRREPTRTTQVYCIEYMIYCGIAGSQGFTMMDVLKNMVLFSLENVY